MTMALKDSTLEDLDHVVQHTMLEHEPVELSHPRGNIVLLSADDWHALQETLYLQSIPGMSEKLITGLATPSEECLRDPDACFGK